MCFFGRVQDDRPVGGQNLDFDEIEDEEDYNEEAELPEHACVYCGIHNPASVVKCVSTGKWFCNSRNSTSASCVVHRRVSQRAATSM